MRNFVLSFLIILPECLLAQKKPQVVKNGCGEYLVYTKSETDYVGWQYNLPSVKMKSDYFVGEFDGFPKTVITKDTVYTTYPNPYLYWDAPLLIAKRFKLKSEADSVLNVYTKYIKEEKRAQDSIKKCEKYILK